MRRTAVQKKRRCVASVVVRREQRFLDINLARASEVGFLPAQPSGAASVNVTLAVKKETQFLIKTFIIVCRVKCETMYSQYWAMTRPMAWLTQLNTLPTPLLFLATIDVYCSVEAFVRP